MEVFKLFIQTLSGLLLLYVGIRRLTNPLKTYQKSFGITFEKEVNVLNELRAIGAVMLLGGVIVLLGTILPELSISSFLVASLIFIGVTMGRILSIILDGKPNKQLLRGFLFELLFGILNLGCLVIALT